MSSYLIALIDIHDPAGYEQYLDGFDQVFAKYTGEVIAVEDHPRVLEGKWPARRTVVLKFPNDSELRKWYDSEEYQSLAERRRKASVANISIVSEVKH
jgi:uncharacterized protein (DUF1330 family)